MSFHTMVDDSEPADQFGFACRFLALMKQLIPSGLDWIDLEGEDINKITLIMTQYCNDRNFFRTNGGWLGLGPRCMRPDDLLVVLHGGSMLYILFMRDCYVASIARGEAYDLIGTDGIEARVFDLI